MNRADTSPAPPCSSRQPDHAFRNAPAESCLQFIEEGKVGTSYVLHLLRKRAHSLELTCTGNEVILGFRHGLSHAQELSLGPMQGSSDAVGNVLGDVILLCGRRNRDQK